MQGSEALSVREVTVGSRRLRAIIVVVDGCHLRTSAHAGMVESVRVLFPGLSRHRCECGSPHGVLAELADTELPHLLEHVALELMALSGSPRSLCGETTWDFATDGRGTFRVSIEYDDDLVALGALREGVDIVNTLIAGVREPIDLDPVVERIRAVRAGL